MVSRNNNMLTKTRVTSQISFDCMLFLSKCQTSHIFFNSSFIGIWAMDIGIYLFRLKYLHVYLLHNKMTILYRIEKNLTSSLCAGFGFHNNTKKIPLFNCLHPLYTYMGSQDFGIEICVKNQFRNFYDY